MIVKKADKTVFWCVVFRVMTHNFLKLNGIVTMVWPMHIFGQWRCW